MPHTESYKLWHFVQVSLNANGNSSKKKTYKNLKTEFNLGTIYVSTRFNTFLWTGNVSIGDRGTRPFLGEACPSHVSYWWISNMGNTGFNGQWQSWDTSKKLPNEGCFSIYRSFLVRGFCENKCWECHGMSTEFLERKWQKKIGAFPTSRVVWSWNWQRTKRQYIEPTQTLQAQNCHTLALLHPIKRILSHKNCFKVRFQTPIDGLNPPQAKCFIPFWHACPKKDLSGWTPADCLWRSRMP